MIDPITKLEIERIELTQGMIDIAWDLARARCGAKDPETRRKDTWNQKDRAYPHFLGLTGEIAVATFYGLSVDRSIHAHGDMADFGDVEVKTSTWMMPDIELKVKINEFYRKCPEFYILSRIDPSSKAYVDLMGFISRREFDRRKREKRYQADNFYVGIESLKPVRRI